MSQRKVFFRKWLRKNHFWKKYVIQHQLYYVKLYSVKELLQTKHSVCEQNLTSAIIYKKNIRMKPSNVKIFWKFSFETHKNFAMWYRPKGDHGVHYTIYISVIVSILIPIIYHEMQQNWWNKSRVSKHVRAIVTTNILIRSCIMSLASQVRGAMFTDIPHIWITWFLNKTIVFCIFATNQIRKTSITICIILQNSIQTDYRRYSPFTT